MRHSLFVALTMALAPAAALAIDGQVLINMSTVAAAREPSQQCRGEPCPGQPLEHCARCNTARGLPTPLCQDPRGTPARPTAIV